VTTLFNLLSIRHLALRLYSSGHAIWRKGAITQGPPVSKVALTFDDGPDPEWTPQILDILERAGVRATFFMIGEALEACPDLGREIAARGHEAEAHLYSHSPEAARDDERFDRELTRCLEVIRQHTDSAPSFLRFPYADYGRQSPQRVRERFGLRTVHWSFSTRDSRYDAQQQVRRVRSLLYPGAVVLLHDGVGRGSKFAQQRSATIEALPTILEICRERRLKPVRLDDLLAPESKE
jgi:peptidoglycan/xylan/chitin deacetylase (PgdA/CDA1 family)